MTNRYYNLLLKAPSFEYVNKVLIPQLEEICPEVTVFEQKEAYANFNILCWNCGEATRRNEPITSISDNPSHYYCSKTKCYEAFQKALINQVAK